MAPTAGPFSGGSSKSGRRAWARATKRRTASLRSKTAGAAGLASAAGSGSPRGVTSRRCSPARRRAARLVARTFRPGASDRRRETSGAAGSRCSKLSRISSKRLPRRNRRSRSGNGPSAPSVTSSACAIAAVRSPAPSSDARGTKHTPSANGAPPASRRRPASSSARRVLPIPGGPSRVSKRTSARSKRRWARCSSSSRPTRGVRGQGTPEPEPGEVLIPGCLPQQSPRYSHRARRATRGALHGGTVAP